METLCLGVRWDIYDRLKSRVLSHIVHSSRTIIIEFKYESSLSPKQIEQQKQICKHPDFSISFAVDDEEEDDFGIKLFSIQLAVSSLRL